MKRDKNIVSGIVTSVDGGQASGGIRGVVGTRVATGASARLVTGAFALACALTAIPAAAHVQAGAHAHGFLDGLLHPLTGIDHFLALAAVGVWSVRQPQARGLPAVFMAALLLGVLGGVAGLQVPGLELGIALTVAALGCMVALAARLPKAAGAAMVAAFAFLHGNAHGHELPAVASTAGMLLASALVMAGARMLGRVGPDVVSRALGVMIASAGLWLMGLN
ncbi:HupE/UreJ family protein [Oxalobacteraceae bacterium]|nr:HupE/UreJ family protein [Oxalobacteraceae bacterium]